MVIPNRWKNKIHVPVTTNQTPIFPFHRSMVRLLAELLEKRLAQTQLLREVNLALHRVPPMGLFQEGRHDLATFNGGSEMRSGSIGIEWGWDIT